MVWDAMGAASTFLAAVARGARVTYLEAKADGGNDAEDGGPGGGPVACGEEAQSKEREALMEKEPSCHKLCGLDATMGISCPVILRERGFAGVKSGADSYHSL